MAEKSLELYKLKNQLLNDAFDHIVVDIHLKKQNYGFKTFLLCGSEPGVGNTTVAINLAISMSEAGRKTLLIDGDMRKIAKHKRLSKEEMQRGLSDVLKGEVEIDEIIYPTNCKLLSYISCGTQSSSPVRLLCTEKMDNILEQLKEEYEYIFIDMPSLNSAVDAKILAPKADGVVIVAAQELSSKPQLRHTKQDLDSSGACVLGVILNSVDMSEYKKHMKNYDYFKKGKYKKNARNKNK